MDKRTYFLLAIKGMAFVRKDWVISAFALTSLPNFKDVKPLRVDTENETGESQVTFNEIEPKHEYYPYKLVCVDDDLHGIYFIDETNNPRKIDGVSQQKALFVAEEPLDLEPGDMINVRKSEKTCYSEALINAVIFIHPFGSRVEYISGEMDPDKAEAAAIKLLEDDIPEDPSKRKPDRIYVDELERFGRNMASLAGYSALFNPAASPKTMTVDPAVIKRRDELFKQYKDQLNDPAIFAMIVSELSQMDKASFKGDESEHFFIKKKMFAVNRLKTFVTIGSEAGFGDKSKGDEPILTSLREKWEIENLPKFADTLRSGSFNRGAQTALGGESVKYFYRVFQNTQVVMDDCKVKYGFPIPVMQGYENKLTGFYPIDDKGKTRDTPYTLDEIKSMVNKTLSIRSPMVCKAPAPSYCAICVGKSLAQTPTGLHIAVSDVGSTFLGAFMAAMHGKALLVARYNFKLAIR